MSASTTAKRSPKTDLRWVKTEARLLAAFGDALVEQPLDKLTVMALARAAGVNKATFYLHYSDIGSIATAYAEHLADQICDEFDNPPHDRPPSEQDLLPFVDHFARVVYDPDNHRHMYALGVNNLIEPAVNRLVQRINEHIAEAKARGLTDHALPSPTHINFALWGLMGTLYHYPGVNREEVAHILRDVLDLCDCANAKHEAQS